MSRLIEARGDVVGKEKGCTEGGSVARSYSYLLLRAVSEQGGICCRVVAL